MDNFRGESVPFSRNGKSSLKPHCQLQAAHFEGADLTGAKFENANINDAYFKGAHLDDVAKKSLINAKNWQEIKNAEGIIEVVGAHFDPDVLEELLDLESKRHQTTEV